MFRPDEVAIVHVMNRTVRRCFLMGDGPIRKDDEGWSRGPNESEVSSIAKDAQCVTEIRSWLSDISWWMRLLSQAIAHRANRDGQEVESN